MLELQPLDVVCTTYIAENDPDGPNYLQSIFSCGIRWTQCVNDVDGKAHYTHTFMITDKKATTFEALWTYKQQNLFDAYNGQEMLIGRCNSISNSKKLYALYSIREQYEGLRYPGLKLPLFLFAPRLLKYIPGRPVCSELTMKALYEAGVVNHWRGVTPSYVADMIRRWKIFDIVYEGFLSKEDFK